MKIFKLILSVATAGLLAGCAGLPSSPAVSGPPAQLPTLDIRSTWVDGRPTYVAEYPAPCRSGFSREALREKLRG